MRMPDWTSKQLTTAGNLVVMFLIIAVLGALIVGVPKFVGPVPPGEIQMGLVIVLTIVCLLVLLTAMAAVYSRLSLADSHQALGLPEGSIRALIALFLIMIFIIMSAYLFRTVTEPVSMTVANLTGDQVLALGEQVSNIQKNGPDSFTVTLGADVSAGAEQLALQLITILGTLVTAVSAFYFGSSTASSAANKAISAESSVKAAPLDSAPSSSAPTAPIALQPTVNPASIRTPESSERGPVTAASVPSNPSSVSGPGSPRPGVSTQISGKASTEEADPSSSVR